MPHPAKSAIFAAPIDGRERLLTAVVELFANRGIGDASLRNIASEIGSSHRMLIYYFQSRAGLLAAVVQRLEEVQRELLEEISHAPQDQMLGQAWAFWVQAADSVERYGALYFELAARAMRNGDPATGPLRRPDTQRWTAVLTELWTSFGLDQGEARVVARLNLAIGRGLLHDLLLTDQRQDADEAMAWFVARTTGLDPRREPWEVGSGLFTIQGVAAV